MLVSIADVAMLSAQGAILCALPTGLHIDQRGVGHFLLFRGLSIFANGFVSGQQVLISIADVEMHSVRGAILCALPTGPRIDHRGVRDHRGVGHFEQI